MTSILQELQAQYEARAAQAVSAPVVVAQAAPKRKATRTYTGEALERRRAWGRVWGARNAANARNLPTERQ